MTVKTRSEISVEIANRLPSGTGGITAADHRAVLQSVSDSALFARQNLGDLPDPSIARVNLGLGSMSTQNSSAVTITGGSIAGIADLAIADGGTGASNAASARANLGLAIGTDVQAYDAALAAIAGLESAADQVPYFTGSATAALATFTSFGRSLVDDADAAAARTTLGATATGTALFTAASVVAAQQALDLEVGVDVQAYDAGLASIASLTTAADRMIYTTAANTYAVATLTAAARAFLDDADAAAQRTTLGLGTIATQDASSVAITGGSISGITDLAVADGGTGASTAAAARTNLGAAASATTITAGTGLTGGGDLSTDRALAADIADQATAEAGTSSTTLLSPQRGTNLVNARIATETEAQAGTNTTKLLTPQRGTDLVDARLADQSTAEAGTSSTALLTPLRAAQQTTARVASLAEAQAGTSSTKLLTPQRSMDLITARGKEAAWTQSGTGAVARTVDAKLRERVSVFDFMTETEINGVVLRTGTASLSTAIQTALTATVASGAALWFPGGQYVVGTSLNVTGTGVTLVGDGPYKTHFVPASGSTETQLFNFDGSCAYAHCEGISIATDGFNTRAVTVAENATVIRFENCLFQGMLNGDVVKTRGQNVEFDKCTFHSNSRDTWGLTFEDYNQNGSVTNCRFGLIGNGARVIATAGNIRPEGIKFISNYWINAGPYNLWIGNSLLTIVTGNVVDQATEACIYISDAADGAIIQGNWVGLRYLLDGTVSIVRSGTIATVTLSQPHYLVSGQVVTVAGADQAEYNILSSITVIDATSFSYTVSGSPASPATGTITIRRPGQSILIGATAGAGTQIVGNFIHGGSQGITVSATASDRVDSLMIADNTFNQCYSASLALDSVGKCKITGNQDIGTPASGSWYTTGSHPSKGQYTFDNNTWHTAAPALYDTASTYRFGFDTGIVGSAYGAAQPAAPATSIVINHGLFRTPSFVSANGEGHQGNYYLSAVGPTSFEVNWTTSVQPIIRWEARV